MCVAVIRANDSIGRADICFVFDDERQLKKIRKSASSVAGITMLKNEIRGLQWYEQILADAFFGVTVISETANYFCFEYSKPLLRTITNSRGRGGASMTINIQK